MPPDDGSIRLDQGLNFSDPRTDLMPGELFRARNCMYQPENGVLEKTHGRSLFGVAGAGPIVGLGHFSFRNGNRLVLAASGTGYYTSPGDGGGFTLQKDFGPLAVLGRMKGVYHQTTDKVYIFDGINPAQVMSSDGSMRPAGLVSPTLTISAAPLANASTLYAQGATFQYCFSEYDSANNVESGPGNVIVVQVLNTGDTIKVTMPASTKNSSTAKWRIYRTEDGGDVFFRIAEIDSTNAFYYDGQNSDAGAPAKDNGQVWGFYTMDDIYLGAQPTLPMVGTPIQSNYITVNGKIPLGRIVGTFRDCVYVAGVPGYPQDLYYSLPREPEQFTPIYVFREPDDYGSGIVGAGVANDRLIVFQSSSMWRHDQFDFVTDPGFGEATRQQISDGFGCAAGDTVCNFGVSQPNNHLFYLSPRGPASTDGYTNIPLGEDLRWTSEWYNTAYLSNSIAKNYPKYFQIWLFMPSRDSRVNDMAWIYHYHPSHQKPNGLGKWTGPIDVRCNAAATAILKGRETRMFVGDTANGNVYLEDSGLSDAQFNYDPAGNINWDWETGDHSLGRATRNKKVNRIFLTSEKSDGAFPVLTVKLNEGKVSLPVPLSQLSDSGEDVMNMGTSQVQVPKTRTYRGGVWKTSRTIRFALQEAAVADRNIVAIAPEVTDMGDQR